MTQLVVDQVFRPLSDGMPIEDWTEYGRALFAAEKRISWAIADWWAFGERTYGDRAKVAAEGVFGRTFQSLMNAGSVARAFPETSRRHEVSFSSHVEVAPLARENPAAAAEVLQAAADSRLTKLQVREAVREARAAPEQPVVSQSVVDVMSVRRLVTYWNRATPNARTEFIELVENADGGFIEL